MEPRPGQLVGRHELVAPLGAGAMGQVWEAILHGPQGFEKPVALKLIAGTGEIVRGALIREARLGALLHHPNVVGIYELGSAQGTWFVAMELVRGPTVAQLARARPLPAAAVLDIGAQAAAGLAHIHALRLGDRPAGLVHRDVKPSNLLVDPSGLVKVADLGMASVADTATTHGGTPAYQAPEQAQGRQDARADVWSLGVVLYELAARIRPFGVGVDALRRAPAVEWDLADPTFLRPVDALVPGLGAVVGRCLRLDPDRRWPTMTELGAALAALRGPQTGSNLAELVGSALPALGLPEARARSESTSATVLVVDGNLPDARDAFHGRGTEVRALAELLGAERVVTLVGFGGVGKTRLALETGRACGGSFAGGVWFVDLSECHSELDVCALVAAALGVTPDRSGGQGSRLDAVAGDAIGARGAVLLVLDNLEQVRGPAAALVGRWRDRAPQASFLCTSRVSMGVRGERLVPVGPLGADDAVALFLDRAAIPPPPEHRDQVRQVVEALDGVPLAIELAAARTRVLSVPLIAARLDDRLRLLAGGGGQYPERHRSLVASIEWSWDLLEVWARAALAQLAVFEGGFTLEAAESVLDLTLFSGVYWAIDVLQQLVDTSLLRVDPALGRFSMLQVVHDFASQRLAGLDRVDAEVRHGRYFASLAGGPYEPLAEELDNLDAAIRRAVARDDGELAGRVALAAVLVYERRGPLRRAVAKLGGVLALASVPPAVRVAVQGWSGRFQVLIGEGAAGRAALEEGLATARAAGLVAETAQLLATLGSVQTTFGELQAGRATYEEALALVRARGFTRIEGKILQNLGNVLQSLGHGAEALATFEQALNLLERDGNLRSVVMVRSNLGALHQESGDPTQARVHLLRALEGCKSVEDRRLEATIRGNLGRVLVDLGEVAAGRELLEAALDGHRRIGNRRSEAFVLANLGSMSLDHGDAAAARGLHEQALAVAREIGLRRLEGGVLCELARGRLLAGARDEAAALVDQAEPILRDVGATLELARVEGLRIQLLGP